MDEAKIKVQGKYFSHFSYDNKTMILVMSLLEMKQDNTIVKRMFRFLNMVVLKENLKKIWIHFIKAYPNKDD